MLVLTRSKGQTIEVDGPATICILESRGNRVRIGVIAGDDVTILRGEVSRTAQEFALDEAAPPADSSAEDTVIMKRPPLEPPSAVEAVEGSSSNASYVPGREEANVGSTKD